MTAMTSIGQAQETVACTMPVRQQLRASPAAYIQALAYNPDEEQLLSVDVEGSLRRWSLRAEVKAVPWSKVRTLITDLESYDKPPEVVLLRYLPSFRCYLILYRSRHWRKGRKRKSLSRDDETDIPVALFLSTKLEALHKFRPSMVDCVAATLTPDCSKLITYDSEHVLAYFFLEGLHNTVLPGGRTMERLIARHDVAQEVTRITGHQLQEPIQAMDLSMTGLLCCAFATSLSVWVISDDALQPIVHQCYTSSCVPDSARFSAASWLHSAVGQALLLTGHDNGTLRLWDCSPAASCGATLLATVSAHQGGLLSRVSGLYSPLPSDAETKLQRAMAGSFFSVGWDGFAWQWLVLREVTTTFPARSNQDSPTCSPSPVPRVVAGKKQVKWVLKPLGRSRLGVEGADVVLQKTTQSRSACRSRQLSLPREMVLIETGARQVMVARTGSKLSIFDVAQPVLQSSRLRGYVVAMKRCDTAGSTLPWCDGTRPGDMCYAASVTQDGVVQVHEVISCRVLFERSTLSTTGLAAQKAQPRAICLDLCLRNRYMACGMSDGSLMLLPPTNDPHQLLWPTSLPSTLKPAQPEVDGPQAAVTSIAAIDDTPFIVTGDADGNLSFHVINTSTFQCRRMATYPGHTGPVTGLHKLPSRTRRASHLQNADAAIEPVFVASSGQGSGIKVWMIDKEHRVDPCVQVNYRFSFFGHITSEQDYTACVVNNGHTRHTKQPRQPTPAFITFCGYADGSLEVIYSITGKGKRKHVQETMYSQRCHAAMVLQLDYLEEQRRLLSIGLEQRAMVWLVDEETYTLVLQRIVILPGPPSHARLLYTNARFTVALAMGDEVSTISLNAEQHETVTSTHDDYPDQCLMTVDGHVLPTGGSEEALTCKASPAIVASLNSPPRYRNNQTSSPSPDRCRSWGFLPSSTCGSTRQRKKRALIDRRAEQSLSAAAAPDLLIHAEGYTPWHDLTARSTPPLMEYVTAGGVRYGSAQDQCSSPKVKRSRSTTSVQEIKKNFNHPRIRQRRKLVSTPEERSLRDIHLLNDPSLCSAFRDVDSEGTGRIADSDVVKVLNKWWPHVNESRAEDVKLAMVEAGYSAGQTLTLQALAHTAAVLLKMWGEAPTTAQRTVPVDTSIVPATETTKRPKSDRLQRYYDMMKQTTKVVYNEMGEMRKVSVTLPPATLDACRGLSKKKRCQQEELAIYIPEVKISVPSRVVHTPLPTHSEASGLKVFADYWEHCGSDVPVPDPYPSQPQSKMDTALLPHYIMEREQLINAIKEMLRHLRGTLLERSRRGLETGPGISLHSTVEAAYKHYLLSFGIPEVVKRRLDILHHSVIHHHQLPICRTFRRILGLSTETSLREADVLPPEQRLLYFKLWDWLEHNSRLVEKTYLTKESAMVAMRELLCAEDYGPRLLVDLEEMVSGLPDASGAEATAAAGASAVDDRGEVYVELDTFLDRVMRCVDVRHAMLRQATGALFRHAPRGSVFASSSPSPSRTPGSLHRADSGIMLPVTTTQTVLERFLSEDAGRSGNVTDEVFTKVLVLTFLHEQHVRGDADEASASTISTDDLEHQPSPRGGGHKLEVSSEHFKVLQQLISLYRDSEDGSICYLDFWAMLYIETFREERSLSFVELASKAEQHVMGLDDIQRQALLVYAGYYLGPRDQDAPTQILLAQSQMKELRLGDVDQLHGHGDLTVCKPTLRLSRACRALIPALGWSRPCQGVHHPKVKHDGSLVIPTVVALQRSKSSSTCDKDYAELRQWDVGQSTGSDVQTYLASVPTSPQRSRLLDQMDSVDWGEEMSDRRHPCSSDSAGGAEGAVRQEMSKIGRWYGQGRAASPVHYVERVPDSRSWLMEEIVKLLPPQEMMEKLDGYSMEELERYLMFLRERKRRRELKETRRRQREAKEQEANRRMDAMSKQELDYQQVDASMLEAIRSRCRAKYSAAVGEDKEQQSEAERLRQQRLAQLRKRRRNLTAEKRKRRQELQQKREMANIAVQLLETHRRAAAIKRRFEIEERLRQDAERRRLAAQEEERRRLEEMQARLRQQQDDDRRRRQADRERRERRAMEAEECWQRDKEEAQRLLDDDDYREIGLERLQEAWERERMAKEEVQMRVYLNEERERAAMQEEEARQRTVQARILAIKAERERKAVEARTQQMLEEFLDRAVSSTIDRALGEIEAEDHAEFEKLIAEQRQAKEEELERTRLQALQDFEIPEEDESLGTREDLTKYRPRVDGIMFYQPLEFAPDVLYDPFDPAYFQWQGKQDATLDSARSSEISEEELPRWFAKTEEKRKLHQDFTTYGEDYKQWPPVFETSKPLWQDYFVDLEKRVLFPVEAEKDEDPLKKLERALLVKKKTMREEVAFWRQQKAQQDALRHKGEFSYRALHLKYLRSSDQVIPLPHNAVFTGSVESDNFVYFSVGLPATTLLTIVLKKLDGDVDAFISKGCRPSTLVFDFKMTSLETKDRLVIYPEEGATGEDTYFIGVYAPGRNAKFSLCAGVLGEGSELQLLQQQRSGLSSQFEKTHHRLRWLADKAASGELLRDFEQLSMMADKLLGTQALRETNRGAAGNTDMENSDKRGADLSDLPENPEEEKEDDDDEEEEMELDELLQLSAALLTELGVDLQVHSERLETWTSSGAKTTVTPQQNERLAMLLRRRKQRMAAFQRRPTLESGFIVPHVPTSPRPAQYSITRLDRSFEASSWK